MQWSEMMTIMLTMMMPMLTMMIQKNVRSLYTYMVLLFPHGQTSVQLKVGR